MEQQKILKVIGLSDFLEMINMNILKKRIKMGFIGKRSKG
jgi:hypothetical protein